MTLIFRIELFQDLVIYRGQFDVRPVADCYLRGGGYFRSGHLQRSFQLL